MMLGLKLSGCLSPEQNPYSLYISVVCFQNTLNVNSDMEIKCLFHINSCTLYVL